jgi:hypothetical protein
MKRGAQASTAARTYQAPRTYVGIFYGALVAWTVICIFLLGLKVTRSEWGDAFQLFTIAFIMAMTWYFSMGVYYRVRMEEDGTIQLTSFKRVLRTHPRNVALIEGPHLPIGFVRFRLEGEKAYLFSVSRNAELQEILLGIWKANPALRVKNLGILAGRRWSH